MKFTASSSDSAAGRSTTWELTVRTGEFYALVSPNGAGKTTTLRMIAGRRVPTRERALGSP